MNIYVGNLPFSTTDEGLKDIFTKFGEVQSAKIIIDRETGRPRGFGFIEMGDDSARKAIAELDGSDYEGKQLTVNEAREKRAGNGGGRGNDRRRSW
jgi:RNA recognition motif-containing protein